MGGRFLSWRHGIAARLHYLPAWTGYADTLKPDGVLRHRALRQRVQLLGHGRVTRKGFQRHLHAWQQRRVLRQRA
jgi:class 3 adenylate cyclase